MSKPDVLVFVCCFEKKTSDKGTTNSLFYNTNVDCKVAPASKATLQEQVNIGGQSVDSAEGGEGGEATDGEAS